MFKEHWFGTYWIFAESGKAIDLMSRLFLFPDQWQRHEKGREWIIDKLTPQLGNLIASIRWFAERNGIDMHRLNRQTEEQIAIYNQWYNDGFCQGVVLKNISDEPEEFPQGKIAK